jgi:hypothetical protein
MRTPTTAEPAIIQRMTTARLPSAATLVAGALALASCAGATAEGYRQAVAAWQGRTIDELIAAEGPPDHSFTLRNGDTVHEWEERRLYATGGWSRGAPGYWIGPPYSPFLYHDTLVEPVRIHDLQCATWFTVDPDGVIVAYGFSGNACRAPEAETVAETD